MLRRHACWSALVCAFGLLSGVLLAQMETRCTATNLGFNPRLYGSITWYNNAWRFNGTSALRFYCTSGYQSACGVCIRTTLMEMPNFTVVGSRTYNSFSPYSCDSSALVNLTTWAGPLTTGKSYMVILDAWSLGGQCPPPDGTFPHAETSHPIYDVPPPPQ